MQKASTLWLVILGIAILLVGGGLGVVYQKSTSSPSTANTAASQDFLTKLNSKVISSMVAYGDVTKVSGKAITLTTEGQSLTVTMKDNATYTMRVPATSTTKASSKKATLSDVKVGNKINISLDLSDTGELLGTSSFIFASTTK